MVGDNDRVVIYPMAPHLEHCYRGAPRQPLGRRNVMTTSVAPRDTLTPSLFAGFLWSIAHDPRRWNWPESTAQYLRYRIETLTAELVRDGATLAEVA